MGECSYLAWRACFIQEAGHSPRRGSRFSEGFRSGGDWHLHRPGVAVGVRAGVVPGAQGGVAPGVVPGKFAGKAGKVPERKEVYAERSGLERAMELVGLERWWFFLHGVGVAELEC